MATLRFKPSTFGDTHREVYVGTRYCGVIQTTDMDTVKALAASVRRCKDLWVWLPGVLTTPTSQRPLGGVYGEPIVARWLKRHGDFKGHLWFDAGRGVLWSPTAWTLCLILIREVERREEAKGLKLYEQHFGKGV